ncbi:MULTISPECIES: tetratricopeptide repeat protein [unclassified Microcoleus]|uniref:tetratricopeptide repeat protein n=1 Tax=unclassified Microcoleus TaxID=2642155 RepID=UPI001DAFC9F4|nr:MULTISPECIES: tetratricopeptide repeat protein [unclassified Microcoleus]MCC3569671.1 tetratricopeptide repeat protein [Microcoleus sp. PH2017_31_RDM_U_A]MCC3581995.1 tetratricopeptide repeat protein [Microcoleus sp. PH2017_32_RDM_D_A]MCC3619936.1 tetratricopeptide repeat protein [Microcoleus sp. PH2017_38_RDM_U_B]
MVDSLKASEDGLQIVDQARRKKRWQKNSLTWVQAAKTSEATLRRFWARKSFIDRYAFIAICEAVGVNWKEIAEPSQIQKTDLPVVSTAKAHPSIPNQNFVGREGAIASLNTHINQGAKIIVIQATGGVGKTTLAHEYLNSQGFDLVLDLPMAKEKDNIQLVDSVIEGWLKQDFDEEPGREFWEMLRRLKWQLQTRKIGVLIDNLEPALDGQGRFIKPHHRYVELLRVLADPTVQSVTLITSRVRLCEPDVNVARYLLPGLDEQAWQQFFMNRHINIDISILNAMHKAYGGNAKVMGILCGAIREDFDGDMVGYWGENSGDLLVKTDLKNLVTTQFDRLQELGSKAYQLLCRLGCYRYQDVPTVPTEGLLCLLWDVPEGQRRRVIESLRNRSLVEFNNGEYWLHPMIREEAIARLRASEDWEDANRKAAEFWTDSVKTVETLEDGLRAFESYYHYVEINDFEQAGYVIVSRRDTSWRDGESLGAAFYRLGLLQPMLYSINSIINKVKDDRILIGLYSSLGDLHRLTGNINAAIECHNLSFKAAETTLLSTDLSSSIYFYAKRLKTWSLFNTGLCRIDLWELEEARFFFQKIQFICKNYNDLEHGLYNNEKDYLYCLAFLNSFLGFKESALSYVKQAEVVIDQIDYCCWSQGYSLLFMGLTYKNLGEFDKSFEKFRQAIAFAEKTHYTQVKAKALSGLAELYREQSDFTTALSHHSESIALLEKIGAKCDLADAHYQRALTYQKMGDAEKSQTPFQEAIRLFNAMEAPNQVEKVRKARGKSDEVEF